MELLLPTLLGALSIPLWILASFVTYFVFELVVFRFVKTSKNIYRTILVFSCLALATIGPIATAMSPLVLYDYSLHFNDARRLKTAQKFWSEFFGSDLEERLYDAKNDSDSAIIEFENMLKCYKANVKFKVGPRHFGKRELAFIESDIFPNELTDRDLTYAAAEIKPSNWIIGIGFREPKKRSEFCITYDYEGKSFEAREKDFQFCLSRDGDDLNLVIYTDKPIMVDELGQVIPVDAFLEEIIGEYIYRFVIGRIEVKKASEQNDDTNLLSFSSLVMECEKEMDMTHLKFLQNKVVFQSCVSYAPQVISMPERALGTVWKPISNRYLPERRNKKVILTNKE